MVLLPGARLGAYELVALIGAGGMGEVYRARDTKLNRDVALKVIAGAYALDAERLARFRREAQVLASLNHPHIGAIYGFEDSGETHALVLELVDGETLADRIARGPLPPDDALPIARQICEALAAAHEQGIIHRDLKPANIKITPDGVAKVLDFGLAKLADPEAAARHADVTASPTITSPAVMTGVGMLLGTAPYMSPEQAKGREADKRSDIWAFGCVLFEMLTGRRAFDGDDMPEVLGAVVRLEPNWEALSSEVPQPVRTLLQSCLVKDRRHRVTDISTALFVLEKAGSLVPATSLDAAVSRQHADAAVADARPALAGSSRQRVALVGAGAFLVGLAISAVVAWLLTGPAPLAVVRMTMITSTSTALTVSGTDRDVAITPDGSRVVYRGNGRLLVRALDQLQPTVLAGLGAPQGIFVSPDGQWVGYFDGTTIKKVAITGGSPVTIAPVVGSVSRGATWGPDGTIVFATATAATALMRVSAAGGQPTVLTKADRARGESDHVWPEFLPGGEAVLYTITPARAGIENSQIAVLDLRTGTSKVLISGGSDAHYVPTGHLVYGFAGTLRAVAFDLRGLEVVGAPAPVVEGVVTTAEGAADVAIAANGALVYISGLAGGGADRTVMSVDRQGHASALPGLAPAAYRDVRVSADGAWLALTKESDVWTYGLARATLSRLTTDAGVDGSPLWTRDGQRIVYSSSRAGYPEIFWRAADGTGSEERLLARAKDSLDLRASGWSADGKQLLFTEVPANIQNAIGQIAIERPSDVRMLLQNSFNNDFPAVSPDGSWIAYHSNLSGRTEIYVERYPQLENRQLISTGGGRLPLWSRDGKELFFSSLDGRQMFAVVVQSGTTFVAGRPQVLFETGMLRQTAGSRPYDIAPDGRFVIIHSGQTEAAGDAASAMILVQNWFEELKRLVPTN